MKNNSDLVAVLFTPYAVKEKIADKILLDLRKFLQFEILFREHINFTEDDVKFIYPTLQEEYFFPLITNCMVPGKSELVFLNGKNAHKVINDQKGTYQIVNDLPNPTGLRKKYKKDESSYDFVFHSTDLREETDELGWRFSKNNYKLVETKFPKKDNPKFHQSIYKVFASIINKNITRRHHFLKPVRNVFGRLLIPNRCSVQGFDMFLHKLGHSFDLVFLNKYEGLEYEHLNKLNLKNKIALDVGSCLGYYALKLSSLVGKNGKVYAFEPEDKNRSLLKKNIAINWIKNVIVEKFAVGNKNGECFLKIANSPGRHAVYDKNSNSQNSKIIQMVRLDDYLTKHNVDLSQVGFVKIDVEGNEFEVLKGMTKIINKAKDLVIQFEYAPQHFEEHGCNLKSFVKFIKQHDFKVKYWDLNDKKIKEIKDPSYLLHKNVMEDFKEGIKYSRNILLFK